MRATPSFFALSSFALEMAARRFGRKSLPWSLRSSGVLGLLTFIVKKSAKSARALKLKR